MEINKLRSIIRESIKDNYLKEIESVAENAAMEARLAEYANAIKKCEEKISMAESLEEMQEVIDPVKVNELKKKLKSLTKEKEKLEKKKKKNNKDKELVTDEPVDEPAVEEGNYYNEAESDDAAHINALEKDMEDDAMNNESINESFLKMQKLVGVITEAQYNSKKSLIKENKTLSPEDKENLDFILGGENLEEGISQMLDRLKSVARQGALTVGLAASLLNAAPASAKSDIITTINTVAPELDLSTIDFSTAQATAAKDDPRIALTANLKSTNPYIINSKTYGDNPIPFTSWNYGANAGKSNATVGLSLSMEKGSDVIKISIAQVPGKSTAGYEAIVTAAKTLGGKVDQYSKSTDVSISKDKASDVANFIKANIGNLTK